MITKNCKPTEVFRFFEEIAGIPRPSFQEKKISDYLVKFATDRKLEWYQDDIYNVIIIKEASEGYEDRDPVIIQGHMDMVCEKELTCNKDMSLEGLDLMVEDGYLSAKGTTLGADDGIAVAMALAILDDEQFKHPRIEFICTVSEETGMEGATGIDLSKIKGRKLINIDSEVEGVITCGCAGGVMAYVDCGFERVMKKGTLIDISVSNCTGGHSGVEIHKGRINASLAANRLLTAAKSSGHDIFLNSFTGGNKDNAIPRDAIASIVVADFEAKDIIDYIRHEASAIIAEYQKTDTAMDIIIKPVGSGEYSVLDYSDTIRVIALMNSIPNGVVTMSQDIEGMVETSLNLGVASLGQHELYLHYCIRSNSRTALGALTARIASIVDAFNCKIAYNGQYPAWEYKKDGPFRERCIEIYKDMYGEAPIVESVHAGLECGVLSSKLPELDAISIGPNILDIHTPQERLDIASTERVYEYVRRIIVEV